MNKNPIISIIVPIYNTEKYLKKCLEHLINQTLEDIEIICVNDGSKDNSLEILEEYSKLDNRIKVFSQKNSGPATARNLALQKSNGKYIMFCDSDDFYELNMCEKMLNTIEKENVDLAICTYKIAQNSTDKLRISKGVFFPTKISGFREIDRNAFFETNVLLWNKIFKKDIIEKYGITFPDGFEHDDDCFIYQYLFAIKSCFGFQDKLYNYFLRENSIAARYSRNIHKNKFDRIYMMDFLYSYLIKNSWDKKFSYFYFCILNKQIRNCFQLLKTKKEYDKANFLVKELLKKIDSKELEKEEFENLRGLLLFGEYKISA